MTQAEVFRRAALERLSSPEQLDMLLEVTRPRAWVALTASGAVLAAALTWGVFGTIPTRIQARGIIVNPDADMEVTAPGSGTVAGLLVVEGELVEVGQQVARLEQPELRHQIAISRAQLAQIRRQQLQFEADRTENPTREIERNALELQARELARNLERLESELAAGSTVASPRRGRVLAVRVKPGDLVQPGAVVLSLKPEDGAQRPLEVLVYVESRDGPRVRPGMDAQISPASARRAESGYLLGRVARVSESPATRAGMMRALGDERLVQSLSSEGAPFAILVEMLPDPRSAGGYAWSSGNRSALAVVSGTMCEVTITIRERRPLSLAIPLLRDSVGL